MTLFSNKGKRFRCWEASVKFLGKPIRVCCVESPDIIGPMQGIELAMNGDKVLTGFIKVKGQLHEYFKCEPI